ncbi:MAG: ACT domain-containing protein, partial [Acidobacteriota bacterium]
QRQGERLEDYLRREGLSKVEDLFQKVAYGKIAPKQVLEALCDVEAGENEEPTGAFQRVVDRLSGSGGPVVVRGHSDLVTKLSKCCSPVPGDQLVGYVTRGRGIAVHAADCPNLEKLAIDTDRVIDVEWGKEASNEAAYPVSLVVETADEKGMLARMTEAIAKVGANIKNIDASTDTGRGRIGMVIEVRNRRHLERMCRDLENLSGVRHVMRQMSRSTARRLAL